MSGTATQPEILGRLKGVRQAGTSQWDACCPVHGDTNASLSVSLGDDGKTLLFCHKGCSLSDIAAAVGMTLKDLFPEGNSNGRPRRRIITTYPYHDEEGHVLFGVHRWSPKDFTQCHPDRNGGWKKGRNKARYVLYRLPELLAADPQRMVLIPAGEKDVDRLRNLGFISTTNPGGEGKWKSSYNDFLRGRHVAILPDNDKTGTDHAEAVARNVRGTAETVKVVELPGLPDKGDVSDWLDAGGTVEELQTLIRSGAEWEPSQESEYPEKRDEQFHLTDVGNAQRLCAQHGQDFRYCYPWSKHLSWDGRRWRLDDTGAIERAAKDTARGLYRDAANEQDADRRKLLAKFAAASEKRERLNAMVALARSEPGIPVLPDELDADPWSLNTPTGTVNLKTGELRPHRRGDLLTKITAAEYLSAAESDCPLWEETLEGIFQGKAELIRYVKVLIGYSLIGEVQEHILPVLWGNGSNGKTLFIETLLHTLGRDYSGTVVSDLLLASKHDQHPTERADLFGKRLVACVETDSNRKLSESAVKTLTGGDTIKARRMREDFWEFQPSHTVLLVTNHKPIVQGTDHGIWRRLRLIPFTTKFWNRKKGETGPPELEADDTLRDLLKAESAGILRWCVDGSLEWQRHGLVDPPEVRAATAEYRRDMDVIGAFIDQCCLVGGGALRVKGKSLYAAFRQWAESSGERIVSQRQFGLSMTDREIERLKSDGSKWYVGIALRADDVE